MYCRKCEDVYFSTENCPCEQYHCRHEYYTDMDNVDDTKKIWAKSPEEAAEKLVEHAYIQDPGDPDDIDDLVEIVGYGKFWVTAECSIEFTAREFKND